MEGKVEVILNYNNKPELKYIDIPLSGKEQRRARRKEELRKRKGRL